MIIRYAVKSCQGGRSYNEDTVQVHETAGKRLYVLADGLGGQGHGEVASATAVNSVIHRAIWDGQNEQFIAAAIESAQHAVREKRKENAEYRNMCTTLVVLTITGRIAQWGHIGDSRLYMFRRNRIYHQTLDHSVPQMLVRVGELDPSQIRKHPDRNRLLHSIGYEWSGRPYSIGPETELMEGDAFLLCSDGFWEYIEETEMISLLKKHKDPVSWLEAMRKIVAQRGRDEQQDNYSAICIKID